MRRLTIWALAALIGATLLVSCGRDEESSSEALLPARPDARFVRLIDQEYSDLRYSPLATVRNSVQLDLDNSIDRERLRLVAMDSRPSAGGLLLLPTSDDPIIAIAGSGLAFNRVTVEMRSRESGNLEVFWARGDEEFAAERRRGVPVEASDDFEEYTVDLAGELDPNLTDYRLRIDPLDRQAPFEIRRIEIGRATFEAEPALANRVLARKVKLGPEVREALVVATGRPVEKRVRIDTDAVLRFAVGRARRNETDVRFSLVFVDDEGPTTQLLEEVLSAGGKSAWREHAVSLRALAGKSGRLKATASVARGATAPGTAVAFWAHPVLFAGVAREQTTPNVLLISLDTVGASHLTSYGAPATADPFLTALARQGVLFENSFASSTLTHVSHGSLLTGKSPLDGSLFWLGGHSISDLTLAEELRRHGYLTAAFTGGVLVTEKLGFDHGFDLFHQEDTLYKEPLQRRDIYGLLDRAQGWAEEQVSPWFLFVHSYEAHSPYYRHSSLDRDDEPSASDYFNASHMKGLNPVDLATAGEFLKGLSRLGHETPRSGDRIDDGDVAELRDVYLGEIAFVDRALEEFFSSLRSRGLLANTIIVLTADHGEAFFEHGLFEHGLLYDENLRVPLIVVAPGQVASGRRVQEPVYATDVMPTILDLAGVESEESFKGRSLVAAMQGEKLPAAPGYAFVPGNGLVVQSPSGKKLIARLALLQENFARDELFDRVADPEERRDMLADGGVEGRRLAAAAEQFVARFSGIHVSLEAFAGEACDLILQGDGVDPNRLYATGLLVERRPPAYEEGPWTAGVRFLEAPQLVVMGSYEEGLLDVTLSCGAAEVSADFQIDFTQVGRHPRVVEASPGGRSLRVWRVEQKGAGSAGGLGAEDRKQLRALGYL